MQLQMVQGLAHCCVGFGALSSQHVVRLHQLLHEVRCSARRCEESKLLANL
jgi:hypothetical protein